MFEIFVLAIVNELYFSRIKTDEVWAEGERHLQAKLELIQQYEKLNNRMIHHFSF